MDVLNLLDDVFYKKSMLFLAGSPPLCLNALTSVPLSLSHHV